MRSESKFEIFAFHKEYNLVGSIEFCSRRGVQPFLYHHTPCYLFLRNAPEESIKNSTLYKENSYEETGFLLSVMRAAY